MIALAIVVAVIAILNVGALALVRGAHYANPQLQPELDPGAILRRRPKPTDWVTHEREAGR